MVRRVSFMLLCRFFSFFACHRTTIFTIRLSLYSSIDNACRVSSLRLFGLSNRVGRLWPSEYFENSFYKSNKRVTFSMPFINGDYR